MEDILLVSRFFRNESKVWDKRMKRMDVGSEFRIIGAALKNEKESKDKLLVRGMCRLAGENDRSAGAYCKENHKKSIN